MLEVWKWGLLQVRLNGEPLQEVDCLKYLRSEVEVDGVCEMDVLHMLNE